MRYLLLLSLTILHLTAAGQIKRNDVIIDEIMADPNPVALTPGGLPESEYVELKNVSGKPWDLFGCTIGDLSNAAVINAHFTLKPDSFVILCSSASAPLFSKYGSTIGVSGFLSLDNEGDVVVFKSKENSVISAVGYSLKWYGNALKSQGGWSLEMIDGQNLCGGALNWTSCLDPIGGTPGRQNSVSKANPDQEQFVPLKSFAIDSLNVSVSFNKPVDSASAVAVSHYQLSDPGIQVVAASVVQPLLMSVKLRLSAPLVVDRVIDLTVTDIRDCGGGVVGPPGRIKTGLPSYPDTQKLVINEILFNPKFPGVDYVELFNSGNSILNLKDVFIGNRSATGIAGSIKALNAEAQLIFPGDYCLLTESAEMVARQYLVKDQSVFCELPSLPSFPDDAGTVLILNSRGKIMDELAYSEKWHFPLISNNEGVALERIDPAQLTQDQANWHSASSSSGFGTPGYTNSQSAPYAEARGRITVQPARFSPDNDGHDDFLLWQYEFPGPGYVCNVNVYDAGGRPVRSLARSLLCGAKGFIRWDGLDDGNKKLGIGIYLITTDAFNLQGKAKRYKNTVVLAAKF